MNKYKNIEGKALFLWVVRKKGKTHEEKHHQQDR